MNKLFNIDTRNWLIGGLILFIIILFFWKPCNKDSETIALLKSENKTLRAEKEKADQDVAELRRRYTSDSAELRGREQLALKEKQEADNKVKQQQRTIDRLVATVRSNNTSNSSNNLVSVSPEYKQACDSLPNEIDKLNASLAEKDSAINDWSEILAYEIQLRDSAIEAEQKHSARINDLYNRQSKLIGEALKAAKPRGRFLIGIGLMGNQEKILGGGSAKAAYLTKKDKLYMYSPHLLQLPGMPKAGLFHEVTVMFNPFK